MTKLGLIAGAGDLPVRLARAAREQGREVVVMILEGVSRAEDYREFERIEARLGELDRPIRLFKERGVRAFCMFGPVRRPSLFSLRLDRRALRRVPDLLRAGGGDDALLKIVCEEAAKDGLEAIGAHEIDPSLLVRPGFRAGPEPDAQAERDIERGFRVAKALGAVDVGQGAVVQGELVLAVEAIEGTDAMLSRCKALARPGPGGVLVKCAKPEQDRRADLPTIGARTVENAHKAGLRGIAIEEGAAIVADADRLAAVAAKRGLFVVARRAP